MYRHGHYQFDAPTMGDIGEEQEEIEVIPLGVPEEAPVKEPSPSVPVPA